MISMRKGKRSLEFSEHMNSRPNTIQKDIHLNIWLAGNSPAGYSAGTILLLITQKIRHNGKNKLSLTQWHTDRRLPEYQISFPLFKVSKT